MLGGLSVGEIPDFLRSGLSTVSCVIGVLIVYEAVVVCSEGSSMTDVVVMVLVGFRVDAVWCPDTPYLCFCTTLRSGGMND